MYIYIYIHLKTLTAVSWHRTERRQQNKLLCLSLFNCLSIGKYQSVTEDTLQDEGDREEKNLLRCVERVQRRFVMRRRMDRKTVKLSSFGSHISILKLVMSSLYLIADKIRSRLRSITRYMPFHQRREKEMEGIDWYYTLELTRKDKPQCILLVCC